MDVNIACVKWRLGWEAMKEKEGALAEREPYWRRAGPSLFPTPPFPTFPDGAYFFCPVPWD